MRNYKKECKKLLISSLVIFLTACNEEQGLNDAIQDATDNIDEIPASEVDNQPEDLSPDNLTQSFDQFELVSVTDTFELISIGAIENGDVINIDDVPTPQLNIVATPTDGSAMESVQFEVVGPVSVSRIENEPVYTVFDVFANLVVDGATTIEGTYTVTVTPYELDDAQGVAFNPTTITFSIVSQSVPLVDKINLVSVSSGNEMTTLQELSDSSQLDINALGSDLLNVTAEFETNPGSIRFVLSGPVAIDRIENNPPYTMANSNDNIAISDLVLGDYSLTVTPYLGPDATGEAGMAKTITFSVVSSDQPNPTNVPLIQMVEWVAINEANGSLTSVEAISNNEVINVALNPTADFNFIAVSEDEGQTGSVHFSFSGPTAIDRVENNPPYTLQDQGVNLSVANNGMAPGSYTLIVTPYAEADRAGEMGVPYQLNFEVKNEIDGTSLLARPDSIAVMESTTYQSPDNQGLGANDIYNTANATFSLLNQAKNGFAEVSNTGLFSYTPNQGFVGEDSFTYQINQGAMNVAANVSVMVQQSNEPEPPTNNGGFTSFNPSADSRIIYVSSSSGNDANNCLSENTPCRSIEAGIDKARAGFPDHIYLKRGDTWRTGGLTGLPSGRSASEPTVLAYYGNSGDRPLIENDSDIHFSLKARVDNLRIQGIELSSYKLDTSHPQFTGQGSDNMHLYFLGGARNIWIEDCRFNHVELILQPYDTGSPENITLRRNIFTGAYSNQSSLNQNHRPSNLYADGVNGLTIEENVFDYGGWHPTVQNAGANMYNHNLYIQYSTVGRTVKVRNNIITRASSHGIHGRPGGLYENNFFGRNTISLQMGYRPNPLPANTFAHALRNVITEGTSMVKGNNSCSNQVICTPAAWGLHTANLAAATDVRVEDNIVSNHNAGTQWQSAYGGLVRDGISNEGGDNQVTYSNNIEYKWDNDSQGTQSNYRDPGRTLGRYNQTLGGSNSFDAFMDVVLNREVGYWDNRYSASAINNYIRDGFN